MKVCVFTGTRAEYGLLRPLMQALNDAADFTLQILATGAHLSPEFGLTYKAIEADGFVITEKVEILLSSDTPTAICKSMGIGMGGFADAYSRMMPDCVVILGDRYEALSAAAAANVCRIPVVHLHGGEITEGAMDDAFRHSISKMSALHFVSTEAYRQRVIQLGEQPESVHNVGAIGVENIRTVQLLEKDELEEQIGFEMGENCLLTTFHPVTLEKNTAGAQLQELFRAVDSVDAKCIFTKANTDTEGRIINKMIDEYVAKNPEKTTAFTSMGYLRYLSAMKHCGAVVGNSSSGILEAPSFGIPTVNIGDRQKGRLQAESVINCLPDAAEIKDALHKALFSSFRKEVRNVQNPYEKSGTVQRIVNVLRTQKDVLGVQKKFYDLPR